MTTSRTIKGEVFVAPPDTEESKFNGGNALGFGWRPGRAKESISIENCVIDGRGVAEGLKLSFCHDVSVSDCIIYGGYEDCVDIVRGGNISFNNCIFISHCSNQHITIKGGAKNIVFTDCEFRDDFKSLFNGACIDLGNWTDYDDAVRPKTRGVKIINCKFNNIKNKILARVLYADKPEVTNCDGFVLKIPTFIVKLFWWGQRKGWLGKRRRMPEAWLEVYSHEL